MARSRPDVAVVTDSTADLPPDLAVKHGLRVVPLLVMSGGTVLSEGVDIDSSAVADALRAGEDLTTSQPPPEAFAQVYRRAAEAGAGAVVSAHLSSRLSGTLGPARLGAQQVPEIEVRLVDSATVAMGLGFAAAAAAEAAATGAPVDEVARAAAATAAQTRVLFYVDTLEYLRRGGRIGAAAGLLDSALAMEPLLHIAAGQVTPLAKVRTAAKARARLVELAKQAAAAIPVDIAVEHLGAPAEAEWIAEQLRQEVPNVRSMHLVEMGAVVGVHIGPGALVVVVSPT